MKIIYLKGKTYTLPAVCRNTLPLAQLPKDFHSFSEKKKKKIVFGHWAFNSGSSQALFCYSAIPLLPNEILIFISRYRAINILKRGESSARDHLLILSIHNWNKQKWTEPNKQEIFQFWKSFVQSLPTTRQSFVTPYLTWHGDTRCNSLVTLGLQAFAPRLWDKVNRANIAIHGTIFLISLHDYFFL